MCDCVYECMCLFACLFASLNSANDYLCLLEMHVAELEPGSILVVSW